MGKGSKNGLKRDSNWKKMEKQGAEKMENWIICSMVMILKNHRKFLEDLPVACV